MAPLITTTNPAAHQALLDTLDIHALPKPFRNPAWKPPQRRNKSLKQILADQQRRDHASLLASQTGSGTSTPVVGTPASGGGGGGGGAIAQATQRLDRIARERAAGLSSTAAGLSSTAAGLSSTAAGLSSTAAGASAAAVGGYGGRETTAAPGQTQTDGIGMAEPQGPRVTYTNIEAAPSLHPASRKRYCDVTGLPTGYTDPKSRLRFLDGEVYKYIQGLGAEQREGYLAARGAGFILK